MIRIAPFGGCGLHNPLGRLARAQVTPQFFRDMGFRHTPFALSANANLQLLDFVTGELDIPAWVRRLTYVDAEHRPSAQQGELIYSGEVALVEMSTPVEYMFEGFLLNINRFEEVLIEKLSQLHAEKKLISKWRSALLKGQDDVRQDVAGKLRSLFPQDTEEERNMAAFLSGTTARTLDEDAMTASLDTLRERLGVPVGLILHNFQFMPDGRPVSWPADFKDECANVAARLGMPTLDFAPFVAENGVDQVMAADRRHWNPDRFGQLGELMYDFCAGILNRAPFQQALLDLPPQAPARSAGAPGKLRAPADQTSSARRSPSAPMPAAPRSYLFDHASGGHMPVDDGTIFAVIVLGQSWACGANGDVEGDVAVSPVAYPGHALMFDAGLRPHNRPIGGFSDLREQSSRSTRETPCAGIADQIMRGCEARFGRKPRMLFFVVGRGGTNLSGIGLTADDGLLRGTVQHREVLKHVHRAAEIAAGDGMRLEVAAICLLHGESDAGRNTDPGGYRRGLSVLQQQYDADIRHVTGQCEPVRLVLTQTNRGSFRGKPPVIPIAQLAAQDDNPFIRCAGPTYFAPPEVRASGNASHVKAIGYRRIGQMLGRYLLDDLWGPGRLPVAVRDASWIGASTIRLRFTRAVAVEQDDGRVNVSALGPGKGIDFLDDTARCPTIDAVNSVSGSDQELDIELSAPSVGFRKRLLIAARLTGAGGNGRDEGARSGIRAREPFDVDPLDGTELFDWACMEEIRLP